MVSASTKAGAHQHMPSSKDATGKSKANGKLDTSPSRAAAIRRGEIQISGPIPIADGCDREPTGPRSTVTTFQTRSDISQRTVQLSREGSETESAADHVHSEIDQSHQARRNQTLPSPMDRTQMNVPMEGPTEGPMEDCSSLHEPGSSGRRNLHDSFRSIRSKSDSEKPGRKGRRLRVVLRRLFGRKSLVDRRTESQQSRDSPELSVRVEHKSDPEVLSRASQQSRPLKLQRSASAPARDVSRPAPLASNSPLPFADQPPNLDPDFNNRDSTQNEEGKRSAPTLRNSLLLSPNDGIAYVNWTGLAPRPASSHERGSRLIDAEAGIGFAITSGTNPRRRSRSVDPAPKAREIGFGSPPPSIRRRRSDGIRYWRESSFSERPPFSPISQDTQPQPEPPPQAFNFGPLIGEMKTMKTTEAASLEYRVRALEAKVANMQSAMWKLRGRPSGGVFTVPDLQRRGDGEESAYSLSLVHISQPLEQANKSPGDDLPGPLEFTYPETFLSGPDRESESSSRKDRPLSLSTAIWAPPNQESASSLDENLHSPLPSVLTHEHFKSLITAVKQEQGARRKLELQVSMLHCLIEEMRQAGCYNDNNRMARSAMGQQQRSYPEPRPKLFTGLQGAADGGEDGTYILNEYAASDDVFGTPLTQPLAEIPTPEQEYIFGADVPSSYNSAPRQEMQPGSSVDHHRLSLSQLTTRSVMEQVS